MTVPGGDTIEAVRADEPGTSDEATPQADAPDEPRPDRSALRWAGLFVLPYLLLGVSWVFSNPPGAAPDEPDHLVKAIGMGRLDIGDEYDEPLPDEPILVRRNLSITRIIDIPSSISPAGYTCYAFASDQTASCLPAEKPADVGTIERETPIGAYPPFAYVPMGVAARAMDTPYHAFLAARVVALVSALAMLFVGAWALVRELGRPALLGGFAALTPMSLFAASSVTTSGLEISSGFAAGALTVVCLRKPEALSLPRIQLSLAGVGTCLILSRQMGVVTLGVLMLVLIVARRHEVWQVVRGHRPALVASVAVLAVATVVVALWERAFDHPTDTGSPLDLSAADNFVDGLPALLRSAVGQFGWLDTPLPLWAVWSWLAVTIVLCSLGLLVGDRGERTVLAVVLVATAGITFATYASVFYPVGASSQGRHLLPLFAFCPVFAGVVIVERLGAAGLGGAVRRLFVGVAVVAAVVQFAGVYFNGRRYAVGVSGDFLYLDDAQWSPTFGWAPWLAVGLAGAVALAVVAVASRPPTPTPVPSGVTSSVE